MAVVSNKSAAITNRDASPRVRDEFNGKNVLVAKGTMEIASGDSIASTYTFFDIPSNAQVLRLDIESDDVGTSTIANIGLYETTANGGAAKDADHFASALSLKDGALSQNIAHESAVFGIEDAEKRLWEALGDTSDANKSYDVTATLTAAADAGGSVSLTCYYTV